MSEQNFDEQDVQSAVQNHEGTGPGVDPSELPEEDLAQEDAEQEVQPAPPTVQEGPQ